MQFFAAPQIEFPFALLASLLTYMKLELLVAALVILSMLVILPGVTFLGMKFILRHSRRKADERTREVQTTLGQGFVLSDATPDQFIQMLRLTSPTLRARGIRFLANRFVE